MRQTGDLCSSLHAIVISLSLHALRILFEICPLSLDDVSFSLPDGALALHLRSRFPHFRYLAQQQASLKDYFAD